MKKTKQNKTKQTKTKTCLTNRKEMVDIFPFLLTWQSLCEGSDAKSGWASPGGGSVQSQHAIQVECYSCTGSTKSGKFIHAWWYNLGHYFPYKDPLCIVVGCQLYKSWWQLRTIPTMPFKWNATHVQVLPNQVSLFVLDRTIWGTTFHIRTLYV